VELLVVGGGVIGLSIAYYCAKAGVDVAVVERGELGRGVTAQTARVVRAYFPGRVNDSLLAVRSVAEYHSFAAEVGVDPHLVNTGFLVLLTSPEETSRCSAELEALRALGVDVELITAAQACEHNPWLEPAGIMAAIWSPQAFSCSPEDIVEGYAAGALRYGARLLTGTAVTGLDTATGRVETTAGEFSTDAIVCAAGPWSGEVAKMAGVELTVTPEPSEIMTTDPIAMDIVPPFTLHLGSGLRTRRLGDSLLVGLDRTGDVRPGPSWREAVAGELARRYPRLRGSPLHTAWTGTADTAPTRTAFIGRCGGRHERFFYATGFSGRGLSQAPMAGQIIRDLYLGRQPAMDISGFTLTRDTPPPAR
jgi:sarcosine oxidase subunit beta